MFKLCFNSLACEEENASYKGYWSVNLVLLFFQIQNERVQLGTSVTCLVVDRKEGYLCQ